MEPEILSDKELEQITGYKARAWQKRWLAANGWHYVESRGGRPLVARQYIRMKLGVQMQGVSSQPTAASGWRPDFSRVR